MAFLSAWLATLTLLVTLTAGAAFAPQNGSFSDGPTLNLTVWHGSTPLRPYYVYALAGAPQNTSIVGPAIVSPPDNKNSSDNQVFFVSCDQSFYPGNLSPTTLYSFGATGREAAIVLYTKTGDYCKVTDTNRLEGQRLFSLVGAQEAANLTSSIGQPSDGFNARIGVDNSSSNASDSSNGTNSNNNNNNNNFSQWQAPPGTALAMIILYAITGCITALFILIIITGTVRAHRHPERYGRRVVGGRTRQTRVGGLARAMLETLPIVKFGDKTEDKDVEMTPSSATPKAPAVTETEKAAADDGIAAASGSATAAELPGCSICTEDFEVGQDQRVLPCEHRFHPACIDPWLLNVSGTCPLCRVDLRPPEEPEEEETPPPEPITPASRRRSVLLAITNLRRPDGMTREERIDALRRYRTENNVPGITDVPAEGAGQQTGRSAQLRRLFNVRTWRTTRAADA